MCPSKSLVHAGLEEPEQRSTLPQEHPGNLDRDVVEEQPCGPSLEGPAGGMPQGQDSPENQPAPQGFPEGPLESGILSSSTQDKLAASLSAALHRGAPAMEAGMSATQTAILSQALSSFDLFQLRSGHPQTSRAHVSERPSSLQQACEQGRQQLDSTHDGSPQRAEQSLQASQASPSPRQQPDQRPSIPQPDEQGHSPDGQTDQLWPFPTAHPAAASPSAGHGIEGIPLHEDEALLDGQQDTPLTPGPIEQVGAAGLEGATHAAHPLRARHPMEQLLLQHDSAAQQEQTGLPHASPGENVAHSAQHQQEGSPGQEFTLQGGELVAAVSEPQAESDGMQDCHSHASGDNARVQNGGSHLPALASQLRTAALDGQKTPAITFQGDVIMSDEVEVDPPASEAGHAIGQQRICLQSSSGGAADQQAQQQSAEPSSSLIANPNAQQQSGLQSSSRVTSLACRQGDPGLPGLLPVRNQHKDVHISEAGGAGSRAGSDAVQQAEEHLPYQPLSKVQQAGQFQQDSVPQRTAAAASAGASGPDRAAMPDSGPLRQQGMLPASARQQKGMRSLNDDSAGHLHCLPREVAVELAAGMHEISTGVAAITERLSRMEQLMRPFLRVHGLDSSGPDSADADVEGLPSGHAQQAMPSAAAITRSQQGRPEPDLSIERRHARPCSDRVAKRPRL